MLLGEWSARFIVHSIHLEYTRDYSSDYSVSILIKYYNITSQNIRQWGQSGGKNRKIKINAFTDTAKFFKQSHSVVKTISPFEN